MSRLYFALGLVALFGMLLTETESVEGCLIVPPQDHITPVQIADESAIIIYNQATKTEHFIRRANFVTDAKDFGFLVPTPTQPTVHEVKEDSFGVFEKITEPEVIYAKRPSTPACVPIGCGVMLSGDASLEGKQASVSVLEEKRVGAFDTAVLKADDNPKLSAWLKKWGYALDSTQEAWLETYTKQGWVITAFKIAKQNPDQKKVASASVRLTFQTDKPFYPYREPGSPKNDTERDIQKILSRAKGENDSRLLRVYYVGDKRVEGGIGEKLDYLHARTKWAHTLTAAQREKCLESLKIPANETPDTWYLTEFEDHSSPRMGYDEFYFKESKDQESVFRAPSVFYLSKNNKATGLAYGFIGVLFIPTMWRGLRRLFGKKPKV